MPSGPGQGRKRRPQRPNRQQLDARKSTMTHVPLRTILTELYGLVTHHALQLLSHGGQGCQHYHKTLASKSRMRSPEPSNGPQHTHLPCSRPEVCTSPCACFNSRSLFPSPFRQWTLAPVSWVPASTCGRGERVRENVGPSLGLPRCIRHHCRLPAFAGGRHTLVIRDSTASESRHAQATGFSSL